MAGAALAALAAGGASVQVVAIDSGQVEGSTRNGISSWKGIPFAQPPVGDLRWRAPQAVEPWEGVRPAADFASDCMQIPFAADAAPLGTLPAEDCLYINVWRPADAEPGEKLPVMFWIYGGGLVNGGASPAVYDGSELARQGVEARFGPFAEQARAAYAEIAGDARTLETAITADAGMVEPARYMVQAMTRAGQPAWQYRAGFVPQVMHDEWPGLPHATEIPFFFKTIEARYPGETTPEDHAMAETMSAFCLYSRAA